MSILSSEVASHIRNQVKAALPEGTKFALFIKVDDGAHLVADGFSYEELKFACKTFAQDGVEPHPLPPHGNEDQGR